MSRKQIEVGGSHRELGNYSHVIEDGRGTFYVSGQGPVDTNGALVGLDDAFAQSRQVMRNVIAAIEAAGLTTNSIVKMTAFLVGRAVIPAFVAARAECFSAPFPASSVVIVSGLIDEQWQLEIDAVAVRGVKWRGVMPAVTQRSPRGVTRIDGDEGPGHVTRRI